MVVLHIDVLGFWIEEALINELEDVKKEVGPIKSVDGVLLLGPYVEKWRVLLWDKTYIPFFNYESSFRKVLDYAISKARSIAINRVFACDFIF